MLLSVGLHLPRHAALVTDERLLARLKSLARLALSAGLQKREFLREHVADRPELAHGFLLDRARVVLAPVGLREVAMKLLGLAVEESEDALAFAQRIVERVSNDVSEDARTRHLSVALEGGLIELSKEQSNRGPLTNGLKGQARVAAALHEAAPLGTCMLSVPEQHSLDPISVVESLRWLWQRSKVTRVQFGKSNQSVRQLTLGI